MYTSRVCAEFSESKQPFRQEWVVTLASLRGCPGLQATWHPGTVAQHSSACLVPVLNIQWRHWSSAPVAPKPPLLLDPSRQWGVYRTGFSQYYFPVILNSIVNSWGAHEGILGYPLQDLGSVGRFKIFQHTSTIKMMDALTDFSMLLQFAPFFWPSHCWD